MFNLTLENSKGRATTGRLATCCRLGDKEYMQSPIQK